MSTDIEKKIRERPRDMGELLYADIQQWAIETFGSNRDVGMLLRHLEEELGEFAVAVDNYKKGLVKDRGVMLKEYADVQILLWNLLGNLGVCYNSAMDGVAVKQGINRKRTWVEMDGKMKHVPDEVEIHEKPKVYMCVVCGEVPVDVAGGYDTCPECASKI